MRKSTAVERCTLDAKERGIQLRKIRTIECIVYVARYVIIIDSSILQQHMMRTENYQAAKDT